MRILHLSTEKKWRGGENQLYHLLKGSQNSTFMHFVAVQPGTEFQKKFASFASILEIALRNELDFLGAIQLAYYVFKLKIDLIHAHTARGHTLAIFAKMILKVLDRHPKIIVHRRVEQDQSVSFFSKWKYLNPNINQYVAVSESIANGLEKIGIPRSRISIVYSGVETKSLPDLSSSKEKIRTEFSIPMNAVVFLFAGAVEPLKGVNILVEAWKNFCKKHNPNDQQYYLLMVGEGSLKEEIKKSNLPNCTVTGFRSDVPSLMSASNILVLPTLWEGLGTVLLDGALYGNALIASRVGGVPEIVRHEETGLLIEPGSPQSLVDAMERLVNDPELRDKLTAQAKTYVENKFSVESMVQGSQQVWLAI